ncbi:DNA-binding protein [Thermococcus chitonophagus]|uniref:Ribonuclease VapC n=1 Tax=Thermococcus chitonophagus TaxID=54262 RepID=A0A160VPW9_9EURY|nr:type II toxin-antitoxin system VapC family toxin [Thermococcus chitonophagus]ASJ15629.1 DNA-binding protein [Thermococcus chitonophagus]CUX76837.1 hypothetical protein CHITON_0058 [Thermococcus chitonophagus]
MARIKPDIVYLDTSAIIALFNSRDENHEKAINYFENAVRSGSIFVLSRPVLAEYLNGLSKHYNKTVAMEHYQALISSKFIHFEKETEEDWERAWEIFFRYLDQKGIDIVDSLSFAIMERLKLRKAFTFDNDFRIHGFDVVP